VDPAVRGLRIGLQSLESGCLVHRDRPVVERRDCEFEALRVVPLPRELEARLDERPSESPSRVLRVYPEADLDGPVRGVELENPTSVPSSASTAYVADQFAGPRNVRRSAGSAPMP
jgi:hypothetical protein